MGFFNSLASKFSGGVQSLGAKLKAGANYIGGKVSSIGNAVANAAETIAPVIGALNPELGVAAAAIGAGARTASNIGGAVQSYTGGRK